MRGYPQGGGKVPEGCWRKRTKFGHVLCALLERAEGLWSRRPLVPAHPPLVCVDRGVCGASAGPVCASRRRTGQPHGLFSCGLALG